MVDDITELTEDNEVPETTSEEEVEDNDKQWYVIHTYSGYENKVRANLLKRIDSMSMKDHIFQVLIPTEDEVEIKDGKKKVTKKKIYPGYLMLQMKLTDDSWYVVRNTTGVTGFVGSGTGSKPIPLEEKEVKNILRQSRTEVPRFKELFSKDDPVKVISGPFADFTGIVEEVYPDRAKLKVLITIFGRETPVEIEYGQVEKI